MPYAVYGGIDYRWTFFAVFADGLIYRIALISIEREYRAEVGAGLAYQAQAVLLRLLEGILVRQDSSFLEALKLHEGDKAEPLLPCAAFAVILAVGIDGRLGLADEDIFIEPLR